MNDELVLKVDPTLAKNRHKTRKENKPKNQDQT